MIACGYINLHHLRSEYNLADVLSKHWGHQNTYELLLKPIFHCIGDVGCLITGQQDVWVDESLFDNQNDHIDIPDEKMGSDRICTGQTS